MVENGVFPRIGGVAGFTGCAKFAVVDVIGLMAGVALGGGCGEIFGLARTWVAVGTHSPRVFPGKREKRLGVVKLAKAVYTIVAGAAVFTKIGAVLLYVSGIEFGMAGGTFGGIKTAHALGVAIFTEHRATIFKGLVRGKAKAYLLVRKIFKRETGERGIATAMFGVTFAANEIFAVV